MESLSAQASEFSTSTTYLPLIQNNFPPPAPSFGAEFWPINANNGLTQMTDAGASWVRRNKVNWDSVELNKGERNWSSLTGLEAELINAQQSGLQVILSVTGTPEWARKYLDYRCGPIKEEEFSSFAKFMADLVARYREEPYNVKYWEIWNEPDAPYQGIDDPNGPYGCWGEPEDQYYGGEHYGKMLAVVAPQMKAVDSNSKILVGGLLLDCDPVKPPQGKDCTSSRFLEGVLISGAGPFFDGVSFHAYDYYDGELGKFSNPNWHAAWDATGPVVAAKANYISSLLENPEFEAGGKFLINSETALLCGQAGDPPGTSQCSADLTSAFELTKAYYVAKAYTVGQSQGLRASIWFTVMGWRNSGLLYEDLTTRLAYSAYSAAQGAIDRAFFKQKVNQFEGVEGYEFSRKGKKIWVLWSQDGINHVINLDNLPVSVYGVLGSPIVPGLTLEVGLKPIYVEWND